jgi:HPt (histidine-containing phosphotransfer) domain-containing protein
MDDFLNKPLLARELMDALTLCRRLPRPTAEDASEFDDTAYDTLRENFRPEDLRDLIELFIADLPSQVTQLQHASNAKNWLELRRLAHGLRSASATFGATGLAKTCSQIEHVTTATNDDNTSIESLVADINRQTKHVSDHLRAQIRIVVS